jgi:hypothetical protein
VLQSGELVVGGGDMTVNGASGNVLKFDGTSWRALSNWSSGLRGQLRSLLVLSTGELVAGGFFSVNGHSVSFGALRWNGTSWVVVGSGLPNSYVFDLVEDNGGNLVAVIDGNASSVFPGSIAVRFFDEIWEPIGNTTRMTALSGLVSSSGEVFVGGRFGRGDGFADGGVARWDGQSWSAMGQGVAGMVWALAELPNGDIVAGGTEASVGSSAQSGIAFWNGSQWLPLGGGKRGTVSCMQVTSEGDLYVGWSFVGSPSVQPYFARYGVPDACTGCDSLDFNRDGIFPTDEDVVDFLSVLSGGACSVNNSCSDIDFNNDGLFPSDDDLVSFFRVWAGGPC